VVGVHQVDLDLVRAGRHAGQVDCIDVTRVRPQPGQVVDLYVQMPDARRRELAVRSVLGASRGRVLRQLVVESVMLACSGAALGVVVAPLVLRGLHALMPPALADIAPAQLDLRVLGFATLSALLIGTGFGLVPALGALRNTAATTLKEAGGHGVSAAGAGRLQRLFVGAQLALTVMLLVAAGLMLRSFVRLASTDIGLDATHVATLELSFAHDAATPAAVRYERVAAMLERLRAVPGITAAGITNDLPLRGGIGMGVSLNAEDGAESDARQLIASEDYFRAVGVQLKHGRSFTAADDHAAPPVLIVNEALATRFWPGRDAVGRRLQLPGSFAWVTVVGVVADVREHAIEQEPPRQLFLPARTQMGTNIAIVARGSLPPAAMLNALTDAVHAVDRSQAVYNVRMMDEVVDASVAARRTITRLVSLFGALALLVSLLGTYAVTAQAAARRTREFGIRAALGATGQQLVGQLGREMVWVAIAGVLLGSWLAWLFARVLQNLIYDVTVHDAVTFLTAPAALTTAVLVATFVPAYRVLRVNPAEVIRSD
jgi:putative ABC transport system permease protein